MLDISFYNICKKSFLYEDVEWSVHCYEGYLEQIFTPNLSENIINLISFITSTKYLLPFRFNLEVGSIQYLIGIRPKDKVIYISSKQLGVELTRLVSLIELYSLFVSGVTFSDYAPNC